MWHTNTTIAYSESMPLSQTCISFSMPSVHPNYHKSAVDEIGIIGVHGTMIVSLRHTISCSCYDKFKFISTFMIPGASA